MNLETRRFIWGLILAFTGLKVVTLEVAKIEISVEYLLTDSWKLIIGVLSSLIGGFNYIIPSINK